MKKEKKVKREKWNSGKRIADKIMIQVGRSVLAVFLIVAILSIFMIQSTVMSGKQTELTLESESASYQLEAFFNKYMRVVSQLAVNPEVRTVMQRTRAGDTITKTDGYDTVYNNMVNIVQSDSENIMAVWIGDIDANVLTQSDNFTSGADFEITERAWYRCTETGTAILTEPYVDASTGQIILSAAAPVYDTDGETVLGVAGEDLSLAHVSEVMQGYKIGNSGYVMLLSSQGTIIYHPDESFIQMNMQETDVSDNIIDVVTNGADKFLKYQIKGQIRYGYAAQIGDTGYLVISSMSQGEYFARMIQMIVGLIILFAIGIVLIIFTIRKLAASMTKPIMELNDVAQELAAGNLDVELAVTTEDEIGQLGQSIGRTVERLKQYIVYIDEITAVLTQFAQGKLKVELQHDYVGEFQKIKDALLNISSSMNQVLLGIKESAEQVSAGAEDLANASQGLAEGAGTQAAAVEELVATTTTITEQVRENREEAEVCAQETGQVTGMMEESQMQMNQMKEAMSKIHETSKQVVGIIQTIEEIADQTNLLALNASIEAARAGEAGKGFAVVADQIGKLADESSKAANTTRELIGISMDEINRGDELADYVVDSLRAVVDAVERVNDMIKKTADNAISQAQNMEQVRQGIEDISEGIQDNSATAEESSATSQELAAQSAMLNEMVQKFELNP